MTSRYIKHKSFFFSVAPGGVEVGAIPIVFDFSLPKDAGLARLEEEKDDSEDGWGIDIGDYPMAILTEGATEQDPIIELAPHVHVVQSRTAKALGYSEPRLTAELLTPTPSPASTCLSLSSGNSSADSTPCQTPTTAASASSSTSTARPPTRCADAARPSSLDIGQSLKRRPHLRRGGTDPHKRSASSPTQCSGNSTTSIDPTSSSLSARKALPQIKVIRTKDCITREPSFLWVPPTPVTRTPSSNAPKPRVWSSPIDWTVVESELGCQTLEEPHVHTALIPDLQDALLPQARTSSSVAERRRGFVAVRKA